MTFHKWAIEQRTRLTTHPADPFDAARWRRRSRGPGRRSTGSRASRS